METANNFFITKQKPGHLEGLNPQQLMAVEALGNPTLVLAGAGTGKTKVLTARVAHELYCGRVRRGNILAVTFTNKSAREMQDRVMRQLGEEGNNLPWLGTFHSIGAKILRQNSEIVERNSKFSILDTDDKVRMLKNIIKDNGVDEKRWPARYLAALIDGWKNDGLDADQISGAEAAKYAFGAGQRLYEQYQLALKMYNAADFGDLILLPYKILKDNHEILEYWQSRFRTILVDEYQDTNTAQYLFLRLLIGANPNICCVGDDDQAIYGWRGARVENMLRFETDFPTAQVFRLEQNYRSTGKILAAAGSIISDNQARLGKNLWTNDGDGEPVTLCKCLDGEEEADIITENISKLHHGPKKVPLREIAILVRTSVQMRIIEDRMVNCGIPYFVVGAVRFYERAEIKNAIAYLNVALNPRSSFHLERILNIPKRAIGDRTRSILISYARENQLSLFEGIILAIQNKIIKGAALKGASELIAKIDAWNRVADDLSPRNLAEKILEESGYVQELKQQKTIDAEGRLENLKELVGQLEAKEDLPDFLEHVSLLAENAATNETDKVQIMTLHAAKGLEFINVFLPGWEEDLFPSKRSLDDNGESGLEEERRLAYVGITRARKKAWILWSMRRNIFGYWRSNQPSRFIESLPPEHVTFMENGLTSAPMRHAIPQQYSYNTASKKVNTNNNYLNNQYKFSSHKTKKTKPSIDWKIGDSICHKKFGEGKVISVANDSLEIDFENFGIKRIISNYVQPGTSI